jgi:flagellar motor switch protein FliN
MPGNNLQQIKQLEVPVIVRLGERTMTLAEILALVPGAIIELPRSAEAELELLVNNKVVGCGSAVKVGENFGIRVSYIGDLSKRVQTKAADEESSISREDADVAALADALLAGQT